MIAPLTNQRSPNLPDLAIFNLFLKNMIVWLTNQRSPNVLDLAIFNLF